MTPLDDRPISIPIQGGDAWQPSNYDDISHGEVPLMDALANSYNQATVSLGLELGIPALFRLLGQLGVEPGSDQHPSAFLGALSLTPMQVGPALSAAGCRRPTARRCVPSIRSLTPAAAKSERYSHPAAADPRRRRAGPA